VIRVTNWQKWTRTKIVVTAIAFFGALACAGGLEAEGTEPIPSVEGFIFFASITAALTYNLIQNDRRRN
jgi:hypothetical protein